MNYRSGILSSHAALKRKERTAPPGHPSAAEDVKGLIKAAEGVAPTRMGGGDFARVVDAGRPIGDRATGAPTSTYTVITKPNGNLVTAFPGKP